MLAAHLSCIKHVCVPMHMPKDGEVIEKDVKRNIQIQEKKIGTQEQTNEQDMLRKDATVLMDIPKH